MKRPIHLYIFVTLSTIAVLLNTFGVFFSKFDEEGVRQLMQSGGVVDETTITYLRESAAVSTGLVNKLFAIVLLGSVIAVIILLFRKQNEQASYVYLAYLFGTLLKSTYQFIASKAVVAKVYSDPILQEPFDMTLLVGYAISVVLFAIFFGVTVFFHLRKSKNSLSTSQTSTDI